MDTKVIFAILPFINFEEKLIRFNDFTLFSNSQIENIEQLSEGMKAELNNFSAKQKLFIRNMSQEKPCEITFLIPNDSNDSRTQIEGFLEVVFFYLHRGRSFSHNLFGAPNQFCREDFRHFVVQANSDTGKLFIKKRFKFQSRDSLKDLIIAPYGCENAITGNEGHGYPYRDIPFDYQNEIFRYLYEVATESKYKSLLRSISYFNRTVSCELTDNERFVWLSAALESFLEIGRGNDKANVIKEKVLGILKTKTFRLPTDSSKYLKSAGDLITVTYDYRSSYVHGSERQVDWGNVNTEKELQTRLGKTQPLIALMNLLPILFLHDKLPDSRIEGILNAVFNNQGLFEEVLKIYQDSADDALEKLKDVDNLKLVFIFTTLADMQTIEFIESRVKACLNNILYIFAKYARESQDTYLFARQVQGQINSVPNKDPQKFEKWNVFFRNHIRELMSPEYIPHPPFRVLDGKLREVQALLVRQGPLAPDFEYLTTSGLAFMKLFSLLDYKLSLY